MRYRLRLLDISSGRPRSLIKSFEVCADSIQEAEIAACERLKGYKIYMKDERVKDYIQMLEIWNTHGNMGNNIDCEGHEFDVLPEVLRKILLEISLIE